nr:type II secretion system protein GspM [Brevundimonas naejangsanensis]
MKALFSSTGAWWDGRSLRERRMLAVMGVVVLGVIAWLGVVRPLDGWKADQARARVAAERQMAQVQTAVAQRGARPTEAVDLQALVASTALTAGVQPTLGMSEGGRLGFRLERVTTAQAFGWLAALEEGGAQIEELGVVENADGTLGVSGALASGA